MKNYLQSFSIIFSYAVLFGNSELFQYVKKY